MKCKDFVYLGSIISENVRLDSKLTFRIRKASIVFDKLQIQLRKSTMSSAKYTVQLQVLKLYAYMIKHLQQIMNIT